MNRCLEVELMSFALQVHCALHVAAAAVAIGAALVLMRTHVFDPLVLQDLAKDALAHSNGTADGVIADVIRRLQGVFARARCWRAAVV